MFEIYHSFVRFTRKSITEVRRFKIFVAFDALAFVEKRFSLEVYRPNVRQNTWEAYQIAVKSLVVKYDPNR